MLIIWNVEKTGREDYYVRHERLLHFIMCRRCITKEDYKCASCIQRWWRSWEIDDNDFCVSPSHSSFWFQCHNCDNFHFHDTIVTILILESKLWQFWFQCSNCDNFWFRCQNWSQSPSSNWLVAHQLVASIFLRQSIVFLEHSFVSKCCIGCKASAGFLSINEEIKSSNLCKHPPIIRMHVI